ncbi:MAG: peptidase M28 family protein [Ignavibacteria bacterium]|nr:peptidase M28 family protein [Ignavibacteria bacterium]
MKKISFFTATVFCCFVILTANLKAQVNNELLETSRKIVKEGLTNQTSYKLLYELTSKIGSRLSGSPQAQQAVEWGKRKMLEMNYDSVWLENMMVPRWVRGKYEEVEIIYPSKIKLNSCALGGSGGTDDKWISAEVIKVNSVEEAKQLGEKAKGKIIYFSRPFDQTLIDPGAAYGKAVDQRGRGPNEASKLGAVAAIVRSMTHALDDKPHTGATNFEKDVKKIPALAISTIDANKLNELLANGKVEIKVKLSAQTLPDVESSNVIGQITGSEFPNEIVLVGGHLDSWDKGTGTHDDGTGCVQAMEVVNILKSLGIKPKRTIRAVLFMNEENGLRGGLNYAERRKSLKEKHIAAIESDGGGFTPTGFGITTDSLKFEKIKSFAYLLEEFHASRITKGGGGADINPLSESGTVMIGLDHDSQRYFDYHHSDNDTIDKVNSRELELGAIAMTILAYAISEIGL